MKRRAFLTTAGSIGAASMASGATVVSSIYTSASTHISLQEFSLKTKKVLEKFVDDLATNVQDLDLKKEIINNTALPVRIIFKDVSGSNQRIVYKNKSGNYINLAINKGVETIQIVNDIDDLPSLS